MTHASSLFSAFLASLMLTAPSTTKAEYMEGLATVELRPGWRMQNGSHMAALHIELEPGWKTYWRAPGDVGIPPRFDWSDSENIDTLSTSWPTPEVFFEQGMRSVGYTRSVTIPLHMVAKDNDQDIALVGQMQIGICKDICIPANLSFEGTLPPAKTRPDPTIVAAMTDVPYTSKEAGVTNVTCRIEPGEDGGIVLHTRIDMPPAGDTEYVVVEAGNPHVWVAEPDSLRKGVSLHASTRLIHVDGSSFALNRSDLRFTVIGTSHAVDIQGCTS